MVRLAVGRHPRAWRRRARSADRRRCRCRAGLDARRVQAGRRPARPSAVGQHADFHASPTTRPPTSTTPMPCCRYASPPTTNRRSSTVRCGASPTRRPSRCDGGFRAFHWYTLIYRTSLCPVTGIGLLAVRDAVSHLRREGEFTHAFGYGVSQSGRLLRQFLYEGRNLDEHGRDRVRRGLRAHRRRPPRRVQPSLRAAVAHPRHRLLQPAALRHQPPCWPSSARREASRSCC